MPNPFNEAGEPIMSAADYRRECEADSRAAEERYYEYDPADDYEPEPPMVDCDWCTELTYEDELTYVAGEGHLCPECADAAPPSPAPMDSPAAKADVSSAGALKTRVG